MDLSKYKKIFIQESDKYLKDLDDYLLRVEKDLANNAMWREIHGKIHSIKGMARALSLETITELAHHMEDWCKKFQESEITASSEMLQLLFDGQSFLGKLVSEMGQIGSEKEQATFDRLLQQFKEGPENVSSEPVSDDNTPGPAAVSIDYVQVRYELIEELLGLSQEIMLHENKLPPLSLEQISSGLKNWIDDYQSMLKGLHFRLAQLRLMTVSDFAHLFKKTIRNMAKQAGKEVSFEVIGGDIQADITILERIREPLIHIFRNAITHGIETPEARIAAGKQAAGKITFEVNRGKDRLFIRIGDDGKGIDRSAVRRHLIEKKGLPEEQVDAMSEEAFYDTILSSDFTSSRELTDMSGRGIGMDVVAQAIEYLGGKMTIQSRPSEGTKLTFRLPLSLSIIHTVTFSVGKYTLSVPTANVISIDRHTPADVKPSSDHVDLISLMGDADARRDRVHLLRIKRFGESHMSEEVESNLTMVVEEIVGNRPLMILPVGEVLAKADLFSGVGVMETGELSLLLDINSLQTNETQGV